MAETVAHWVWLAGVAAVSYPGAGPATALQAWAAGPPSRPLLADQNFFLHRMDQCNHPVESAPKGSEAVPVPLAALASQTLAVRLSMQVAKQALLRWELGVEPVVESGDEGHWKPEAAYRRPVLEHCHSVPRRCRAGLGHALAAADRYAGHPTVVLPQEACQAGLKKAVDERQGQMSIQQQGRQTVASESLGWT